MCAEQTEAEALRLLNEDSERARAYLTDYAADCARTMMNRWRKLGEYLVVKFNDQAVKPEKDGKFELTPDGLGKAVERPGFNESYKKRIIEETKGKYLIPEN